MAHSPWVVLVHSPLVGPLTWSAVANELRAHGLDAITTPLQDGGRPPYWSQHAASVRSALANGAGEQPLLFVAHSGAGPLLPVIARVCARPVAGYIFVDAGLPAAGSRLDAMEQEGAAFAHRLRESLDAGRRYPAWTDDDLRPLLPDSDVRRALLATLRPRGLDFFTEPLPAVTGWPDAPCAYLQFSHAYDVPAAAARARGWPVGSLDAGHFHMLVDPQGVARELVGLAVAAGMIAGRAQ